MEKYNILILFHVLTIVVLFLSHLDKKRALKELLNRKVHYKL